MVSVSLCMIVKNEEDVLERCLESAVDLVDEIIIVDTGSTDRTKEIAGRFTDQIYDFPWCDDFAAARNESWCSIIRGPFWHLMLICPPPFRWSWRPTTPGLTKTAG